MRPQHAHRAACPCSLPLHLPAYPTPAGTQHYSETEVITSAVMKTEEAGQPAGRALPGTGGGWRGKSEERGSRETIEGRGQGR